MTAVPIRMGALSWPATANRRRASRARRPAAPSSWRTRPLRPGRTPGGPRPDRPRTRRHRSPSLSPPAIGPDAAGAAHLAGGDEHRGRIGQFEVGVAGQPLLHGHRHLHAGQVRTEGSGAPRARSRRGRFRALGRCGPRRGPRTPRDRGWRRGCPAPPTPRRRRGSRPPRCRSAPPGPPRPVGTAGGNSSTAEGISHGSATSRCRSSGWLARCSSENPMPDHVVSMPAMRRRNRGRRPARRRRSPRRRCRRWSNRKVTRSSPPLARRSASRSRM